MRVEKRGLMGSFWKKKLSKKKKKIIEKYDNIIFAIIDCHLCTMFHVN